MERKEITEISLVPCASYVQDTASAVLKSKNNITYYIRHRSFSLNSVTDRKAIKRTKTIENKKIGIDCPSVMVSIVTEDRVTVKFYPIYRGHECEVGKLSLSKTQRTAIGSNL